MHILCRCYIEMFINAKYRHYSILKFTSTNKAELSLYVKIILAYNTTISFKCNMRYSINIIKFDKIISH